MFDYYQAPPQAVFDEIKQKSIELWQEYDNEYGYVDEKLKIIDRIDNIQDNAAYIIGMFDYINQRKLFSMLELDESIEYMNNILTLS